MDHLYYSIFDQYQCNIYHQRSDQLKPDEYLNWAVREVNNFITHHGDNTSTIYLSGDLPQGFVDAAQAYCDKIDITCNVANVNDYKADKRQPYAIKNIETVHKNITNESLAVTLNRLEAARQLSSISAPQPSFLMRPSH